MDEFTVVTLIAEGENSRIDFKRQLDLTSAEGKAEFVKDVIALANSASSVGCLLIGVDDTKYITGIARLEEEQIQQIAYTYITPAVTINCSLVPISSPTSLLVGVIEIQGTKKPHKAARAIGRLIQDEVFVRRGSIVTKASPEEIIELHQSSWKDRQKQQYVLAAKSHLKVENYDSAIAAYSKAIEDDPSYGLFIARGEAYLLALEQHKKSLGNVKAERLPDDVRSAYYKKRGALIDIALSDFTSAVRLADSAAAEKDARLMLFRFGCSDDGEGRYSWEQKDQDFEWLRKNLSGRELGEAVYLYVYTWDLSINGWEVGEEVVDMMNEATELGYAESLVFHLRAQGHILAGNYGMAVQDIDKAMENVGQQDPKRIVWLLCDRARALCGVGRFSEAYQSLSKAGKLDQETASLHIMIAYRLEERILYECALSFEFYDHKLNDPMKMLVKILTLWLGRSYRFSLESLENECPGILQLLQEILGQDLWSAMRSNPNLTMNVQLPRL